MRCYDIEVSLRTIVTMDKDYFESLNDGEIFDLVFEKYVDASDVDQNVSILEDWDED